MATATTERKMTTKDRETTLADVRERVRNLYELHGEAIANNEMIRFGFGLVAEMKFLLEEVDRLTKVLKRLKAPIENAETE